MIGLPMFTEAQITHLSTLRYINNIDRALRIVSAIRICRDESGEVDRILLLLELYYNNERLTELSFNLHNYTYEDIIEVTRNVGKNEYIMYEVDTYLSGDIE